MDPEQILQALFQLITAERPQPAGAAATQDPIQPPTSETLSQDVLLNAVIGGDPSLGLATGGIEPEQNMLSIQLLAGLLTPGVPAGPVARSPVRGVPGGPWQ